VTMNRSHSLQKKALSSRYLEGKGTIKRWLIMALIKLSVLLYRLMTTTENVIKLVYL
jgi:hypothetical protein